MLARSGLGADGRAAGVCEQLAAVEDRDAREDLVDELVGQPARVLRPLLRVEELDDLPEPILLRRCDRDAARRTCAYDPEWPLRRR